MSVLFEITGWLKYASWTPIEILDAFRFFGIPEPNFGEWYGAHKLWAFFRHAPLSIVSFLIGLTLTSISRILFSHAYNLPLRHDGRGMT